MTILSGQMQLHHYTSQSSLLGILESGEFWFSTLRKLNDPMRRKTGRLACIRLGLSMSRTISSAKCELR